VTNDVAQSIMGINIIGPRRLVMDPVSCTVDFRDEGATAALGVLGQIRHDVTTPYHPACNSAVETLNKILKHYIATALVDREASTLDWEAYLAPLLFAYNTAVLSSTKVTPFEATFGYDP
jgi:hypothetical protein